MTRELTPGYVDIAETLILARYDDSKIVASLVYRGLEESAATKLVADLRQGKKPVTRSDLPSAGGDRVSNPRKRRQRPIAISRLVGNYSEYFEVPWYRRSGVNTLFVVGSLVTAGLFPGILLVCLIVLTGNVYYNKKTAGDTLETWGTSNKVVAIVLLLVNVVWLLDRFVSVWIPTKITL